MSKTPKTQGSIAIGCLYCDFVHVGSLEQGRAAFAGHECVSRAARETIRQSLNGNGSWNLRASSMG
jgi:hypothetical protein